MVHNCTPNHLHTQINRQILRAGKHVFSEKPLCMTPEEARLFLRLNERAVAQRDHLDKTLTAGCIVAMSIQKIAQLAGVSVATVSRVLNNSDTVKAKNRERVLQAIQESNYQPNLLARNAPAASVSETANTASGGLSFNRFCIAVMPALELSSLAYSTA